MSDRSTDRPAANLPENQPDSYPDRGTVIIGGGLIGLTLALELHHRQIPVTVLETGRAMAQASTAAAGMLAAEDPHNPPELAEISRYSRSLYPAFLERIERLSNLPVPIQTKVTIQHSGLNSQQIAENSLDPRQLAAALLAAVRVAKIDLREDCGFLDIADLAGSPVILAAGAWSDSAHFGLHLPITPRKGQMLRVALPESLRGLREVHRSEHIYVVPRTQGPQAGSALIGATVEDVGFDVTTCPADLARLRSFAAELLPALADEHAAPMLESWAGLRPATPDQLPLLGRLRDASRAQATFVATGHFRNGILLAPATAVLIADLLESRPAAVPLHAFAPDRFSS